MKFLKKLCNLVEPERIRFPEANCTVCESQRDGLPVFATLNLAYKRYQFKSEYPWNLEIEISMNEVNNDGLPLSKEAEVLNEIEDLLEEEMREMLGMHYIARQTWNGIRLIDYYVSDRDIAESALLKLINENRISRKMTYKISSDIKWDTANAFLRHF